MESPPAKYFPYSREREEKKLVESSSEDELDTKLLAVNDIMDDDGLSSQRSSYSNILKNKKLLNDGKTEAFLDKVIAETANDATDRSKRK